MNYWSAKKVIVTGANGFVGKHLVRRLEDLGALVFKVAKSDYNLCIEPQVHKLFEDFGRVPHVVFHLAASVGGIGANKRVPANMYNYNVLMDATLIRLSAVKRVGIFVGMGSVCAYPKYASVPFREVNLWDGYPEETNAAYGMAKRGMLTCLQAHGEQFDMDWRYALSTNLYGPGDSFDPENGHVIAGMIRKFEDARETKIVPSLWGTGEVTRDFLYIDDIVTGLLLLPERGVREPINFGSGRETTIKELAERVSEACGYTGPHIWNRSKPNGQPRRVLDTGRAKMLLGWQAGTSLELGLPPTVHYYRELSHA